MAGLGPKPRLNMQAGGGGGDGFPTFYQPPAGNMAPPSGGVGGPPQPMPQPVSAPVSQPAAQPWNQSGSSFGVGGQPPVSGSMGTMQPMKQSTFQPQQQIGTGYDDDLDNEPPLLEELGINVEHVVMRMKGVAFFKQVPEDVLADLDLSGPVAIIGTLMACQLFSGKIVGGFVYGFFMVGSLILWMLLNVMSANGMYLYRTVSILGYGLIPMIIVAFVGIFVKLQSTFGVCLSAVCVLWAVAAASRFFATANSMANQRWLVAYPVLLFYMCFVLITVF